MRSLLNGPAPALIALGMVLIAPSGLLAHGKHALVSYGALRVGAAEILLDVRADLDHFEELISLDADLDGTITQGEVGSARGAVESYCRSALLFLWEEQNHPPILYSITLEPAVTDEEGLLVVPEQLLLRLRVRDYDARRPFVFHSRFLWEESPDACLVLRTELPTGLRVMALGPDDYLSTRADEHATLPADPLRRPVGPARGRLVHVGDSYLEAFTEPRVGRLYLYVLKEDRHTCAGRKVAITSMKIKTVESENHVPLDVHPTSSDSDTSHLPYAFVGESEYLKTDAYVDVELNLAIGGQSRMVVFRAGPLPQETPRSLFVCPEHLSEMESQSGNCSQCGRALVRLEGSGHVTEAFAPPHGGEVYREEDAPWVLEGMLSAPELFRLYAYTAHGSPLDLTQARATGKAWTRGKKAGGVVEFGFSSGENSNEIIGSLESLPTRPVRIQVLIDFNDGNGPRTAWFDFAAPAASAP